MKEEPLHGVRFRAYQTYEEMALRGEIPTQVIAIGLTLERAKEMVERLGFGYSCYPLD
jgi:hypothetical protein